MSKSPAWKVLRKAEDVFLRAHGYQRVQSKHLPTHKDLASLRNNYQAGEWFKPFEPGSHDREGLLQTLRLKYLNEETKS
jgi:hypothetical protein